MGLSALAPLPDLAAAVADIQGRPTRPRDSPDALPAGLPGCSPLAKMLTQEP